MRPNIVLLVCASLLGVGMTHSVSAQQSVDETSHSFVDDTSIKAEIYKRGMASIDSGYVSGETLLEQLESCPKSRDLDVPMSEHQSGESVFDACLKSTLVMGNLYDCGKCNKTHLGTAGAVVLSEDGLVLTNYHVVDNEQSIHLLTMGRDGKTYPVVEVVAANELADLAVVRIDAENLTPVQLAEQNAEPLEELFVISHPHDRFFLTTTGVVSRYAYGKKKSGERASWMEITAVFSQGSSGCGVFDEKGRLIGLVSRKDTVYAKGSNGKSQQTMTIRKCVPISAIHEMINGAAELSESDSPGEN